MAHTYVNALFHCVFSTKGRRPLITASLQERLWVAADEFQPRKEEWYEADGQLAFSAELGEFDRLAPGRPAQLKVLTPNPQVELRLTYQEFTPEPSLTPADLVVPRPTGTAVLPLKP